MQCQRRLWRAGAKTLQELTEVKISDQLVLQGRLATDHMLDDLAKGYFGDRLLELLCEDRPDGVSGLQRVVCDVGGSSLRC